MGHGNAIGTKAEGEGPEEEDWYGGEDMSEVVRAD